VNLSEFDISCFERSIELAHQAELEGNLPIGAVISLDGGIIGEGRNRIWTPAFNPNRHAEVEALRSVPQKFWARCREMTLYTTLEPCLMCLGAILLHRIGRVCYGSADGHGGGMQVVGHMSPYFENEAANVEWLGPAYPEKCDELFRRAIRLIEKRRDSEARRPA
jgi:tRNA(adenine34) deaminase